MKNSKKILMLASIIAVVANVDASESKDPLAVGGKTGFIEQKVNAFKELLIIRRDNKSDQAQEDARAFNAYICEIEKNTNEAIQNFINVVNEGRNLLGTVDTAAQAVFNAAYGKDGKYIIKMKPLLRKVFESVKRNDAFRCSYALLNTKPQGWPSKKAAHVLFAELVKAAVFDIRQIKFAEHAKKEKVLGDKILDAIKFINAINTEAMEFLKAYHKSNSSEAKALYVKAIYEETFLGKYAKYKEYGIPKGSSKVFFKDVVDEFLAKYSLEGGGETIKNLLNDVEKIALANSSLIMKSDYQTADYHLFALYLGKGEKKVIPSMSASNITCNVDVEDEE
jgi:hypothetical protein